MASARSAASGLAPLAASDAEARIAELAARYSLEVSSRSARDLDACLTHLERGSDVYINFIAGDDPVAHVRDHEAIAGTCRVPSLRAVQSRLHGEGQLLEPRRPHRTGSRNRPAPADHERDGA